MITNTKNGDYFLRARDQINTLVMKEGANIIILKNLKASRVMVLTYGIFCGFLGLGHGLLEVLQGNTSTKSLIIDANGHQTDLIFQGSEPAMTIIPNFLVTGIVAMVVSLSIILFSLFLKKRRDAIFLILLSMILLFVGGGFTPIPFGVLAGIAGIGLFSSFQKVHQGNFKGFLKLGGYSWLLFYLASIFWYPNLASLSSVFHLSTTTLGALGLLICLVAVLTGFANDIQN